MKILKSIVIISSSFFSLLCHAKNIDWNDYQQSATQIKEPVLFLDQFGRFSQLDKNFKLSLVDYGDKNKKYSGGDYILKSYGIEFLNNQKEYILYQSTVPLKSTVDLKILYQDKKIVAFRIREFSELDYVKRPYKKFISNFFIYNKLSNLVIEAPVVNSSSTNLESDYGSILAGDNFSYIKEEKKYLYNANIRESNRKINDYKLILDSDLKCLTFTLGCENINYRNFLEK